MANGIVWYGERGVVNALVTEWAAGDGGPAEAVRTLLQKAVRWCGDTPSWIADISKVTFLIELGMGQFGNPDLILVCHTAPAESPYVVFFEAKLVMFLESAMKNAGSMAALGYNSSINGQLVLRHRLIHALSIWCGTGRLVEPANLYEAYRRSPQDGGLGDPAQSPRHLDKTSVHKLLREHGVYGPGLERYHLVAWTWDREPFFGHNWTNSSYLMPRFLEPTGLDAWGGMKARVGWIGFCEIENDHSPGPAYKAAVATMLTKLTPPERDQQAEVKSLRTDNFRKFGKATMGLVAELEALASDLFGRGSVERKKGSSSVKIAGQVRVKFIPWEPGDSEHVLLGLRATLAPKGWCEHDFKGPTLVGGGNRKPFFLLRLPHETADALTVAGEILQLLQDRFRELDCRVEGGKD